MGSFSWLRADVTTNKANIAYGDKFACLIPKEFGGGYITDQYQDYGYLGTNEDKTPKYDMYELLAFWNKEQIPKISSELKYTGDFPLMKEIDEYTDHNRSIGIDIGCYDKDIARLKYPLKLVSISYAKNHTYEECPYISFKDTEQGAYSYNWHSLYKNRTYFASNEILAPKEYIELLQGRIDYIKSRRNLSDYNYKEIKSLEKLIDICVVPDYDINRLNTLKRVLDDSSKPDSPTYYRTDLKTAWIEEIKSLCDKRGIKFSEFILQDDKTEDNNLDDNELDL